MSRQLPELYNVKMLSSYLGKLELCYKGRAVSKLLKNGAQERRRGECGGQAPLLLFSKGNAGEGSAGGKHPFCSFLRGQAYLFSGGYISLSRLNSIL